MIFLNRTQAGEKLAQELRDLDLVDSLVLAIPRGGVPVAAAVAKILGCSFDIVPMVKVPIPWSPEASYGAIASDGTMALNQPLIHRLEVSLRELEMAALKISEEAKRRERLYRGERPYPALENRTVTLIDDGLCSGYSMLTAIYFARKRRPKSIIVAAPVASEAALMVLSEEPEIDRLVVLSRDAEQVFSLNAHYKDFTPITDDDVIRYLSPMSK
jgi:predicted phosphoribosyltransferase